MIGRSLDPKILSYDIHCILLSSRKPGYSVDKSNTCQGSISSIEQHMFHRATHAICCLNSDWQGMKKDKLLNLKHSLTHDWHESEGSDGSYSGNKGHLVRHMLCACHAPSS